MESLDAQCLLMQAADGELQPPDLWRHDSSGALSCAYEGGETTFTWTPDQVAKMAGAWLDSDPARVPDQARVFVEAHRQLVALASEAGLGPADLITHHLGRGEIRASWDDRKMVVVVERVGERGSPRIPLT